MEDDFEELFQAIITYHLAYYAWRQAPRLTLLEWTLSGIAQSDFAVMHPIWNFAVACGQIRGDKYTRLDEFRGWLNQEIREGKATCPN
jgi:hypothetical protein